LIETLPSYKNFLVLLQTGANVFTRTGIFITVQKFLDNSKIYCLSYIINPDFRSIIIALWRWFSIGLVRKE